MDSEAVYAGLEAQRKAQERAWETANLSEMSDKKLAQWHSRQEPHSRGEVLAQHEWQKRLSDRQIRASQRFMVISILGTLFGVVLGWWLSKL